MQRTACIWNSDSSRDHSRALLIFSWWSLTLLSPLPLPLVHRHLSPWWKWCCFLLKQWQLPSVRVEILAIAKWTQLCSRMLEGFVSFSDWEYPSAWRSLQRTSSQESPCQSTCLSCQQSLSTTYWPFDSVLRLLLCLLYRALVLNEPKEPASSGLTLVWLLSTSLWMILASPRASSSFESTRFNALYPTYGLRSDRFRLWSVLLPHSVWFSHWISINLSAPLGGCDRS